MTQEAGSHHCAQQSGVGDTHIATAAWDPYGRHAVALHLRQSTAKYMADLAPLVSSCRPRLVGIEQSSQIDISGIALTDPIYWSLHIIHSSQVVVRNLTIVSDFDIANTDGKRASGACPNQRSAVCLGRVVLRWCRLAS